MIPDYLVSTVAAGALVLAVLAFVLGLWAVLRLRRLGRPRAPGALSDAALISETERVDRLARQLADVVGRFDATAVQARGAIQHVGVVRYNPFQDTGSNQSFVLCMLDGKGDGFVLSSLHSRQQTRMFLKSVSGGKAESATSDEEAEAIRLASAK
ncbi:MAG: DUF4446 family protein [Chloroflexota bacterium]